MACMVVLFPLHTGSERDHTSLSLSINLCTFLHLLDHSGGAGLHTAPCHLVSDLSP